MTQHGYSESSKAYRIYYPWFKKIDIIRDVTFDKDSAYNKSRKRHAEETEVPKIHDTTMNEEIQEEDRELEEPQEHVDPPVAAATFSPILVFHLKSGFDMSHVVWLFLMPIECKSLP